MSMNKNQANHQIMDVKKHNKLCPISFGNRIAERDNSIDKKKPHKTEGCVESTMLTCICYL